MSTPIDGADEFEFSVSKMLCSWRCLNCESPTEFAILTAVRGEDELGSPYTQVFNWGNTDRPPFCPHCGSKEKVSRKMKAVIDGKAE